MAECNLCCSGAPKFEVVCDDGDAGMLMIENEGSEFIFYDQTYPCRDKNCIHIGDRTFCRGACSNCDSWYE